ncbi:hypothetical protein SO802_015553 [Lithocarpus litseifolius]|uniref:Uncharacterized protein n=1 Tax=Lithocarpus litseifolius TaxID=425828 RepID=A0AAW2CWA4_9ROSI
MQEHRSFRKRKVFLSLKHDIAKSVQAAFMAEEWVDHALDQGRQTEGKPTAAEKAHAEVVKKLKKTLAQLTKAEKAQKNAEAALANYERQAAECLEAQKKAENKLALNMEKLK